VLFDAERRRRRGPGLTPLIDVVFLLLVFFMLASRFDREARVPLGVRVASAESRPDANREPPALVVALDAEGGTWIADRRVGKASLGEALREAARDDRMLRIRPAAETPLQPIVDLLGTARSAGAVRVDLERPAPGSD
jgi:biopolymer transport protein ExbD